VTEEQARQQLDGDPDLMQENWVFHGALDPAVKVSRNIGKALEKAGGHPLYTEYPDEGHASWVPAYRAPAMMKWLFAQKRP
jgi:hypothetical protein